MRVLPTNTTTPRYNNKYIRVSSRNNFPPIYHPPPLSCVPSQTRPSPFILLRATTIVNQHCCNWTCRWIFLSFSPSPSASSPFLFSTLRADSEAASGILSWLCPNELTQFVCVAPAEFSFVFSRTLRMRNILYEAREKSKILTKKSRLSSSSLVINMLLSIRSYPVIAVN